MTRARVSVRWDKTAKEWAVFSADREFEGHAKLKAAAVVLGAKVAKGLKPAELFVYTKAGRITERRTFGQDPERRRG